MTTPTTEAGRALLADWDDRMITLATVQTRILAIEAEARANYGHAATQANIDLTNMVLALREALARVMADVRGGYEVGMGATGQAIRVLTDTEQAAAEAVARIEQRGFHRGIEYVRQAVASEPTLAWPGEIDDILDRALLDGEA